MNTMTKNIAEAIASLTTKPLFATSVERVLIMDEIKSKYNSLPQPIRMARSLYELLDRVSVPLEPYDLIVGRCVDRELSDEEEAIYQAFLRHPDYPRNETFLDSGHCTYSWESIIQLGLPGLKDRIYKQLERYPQEDKQIFLQGILGVYEAIEHYLLRYADAAEAKGMTDVAANCRKAALCRDNDFWSGLQLLWTITFVVCAYVTPNPTLTVGRMDQLLYPMYKADIASGRLTVERAEALITDYYCKHNLNMGRGEHQMGDASNSTTFERIFNFDAPQYMQLGGLNKELKPTVNELTYLFVKCIQPEFKNPVAVIQYHVGLDQEHPELWKTIVQKALQSSPMMIYNDNNVIDCFLRMGIPVEDAVKHAHFGCNWSSLGENSHWSATGPSSHQLHVPISQEVVEHFQKKMGDVSTDLIMAGDIDGYIEKKRRGQTHYVECFMQAYRELAEKEEEPASIEELYSLFFSKMREDLDFKFFACAEEVSLRKQKPSAMSKYADCFLDPVIEKAQTNSVCAKYQSRNTSFVFLGTVADCFICVDKLVFIDKKLTMKELLAAVDANFEGYPQILAMCRNVEKFGSDTPHSNAWIKRLSEDFYNTVVECYTPYFKTQGIIGMPCMQCDTGHLRIGSTYGATPDGRLAGQAFSQNNRPSNGACINGLSGMFNSLLSIPHDARNSGALNVDVDPKQFPGEAGTELFGRILASYFNRGGLHAQISSTNVEELLDAQENPDQHRDLRVRITGYSGIFVDLCKDLQDDIIERFK